MENWLHDWPEGRIWLLSYFKSFSTEKLQYLHLQNLISIPFSSTKWWQTIASTPSGRSVRTRLRKCLSMWVSHFKRIFSVCAYLHNEIVFCKTFSAPWLIRHKDIPYQNVTSIFLPDNGVPMLEGKGDLVREVPWGVQANQHDVLVLCGKKHLF